MHTYTFEHCLDTGMRNGDKASPSIGPAGRGQFVKMLITLEPREIFIIFYLPIHFGLSFILIATNTRI